MELLSRFLTNAQAKAVLAGLADGSVDVVVGTHRLLGEDVTFKKLGLLVVDEEQRFGVSHKESIKAMADGVDVLTLTASPIPRTLEMALTGIRDLSMVNTPPAARRPILTHVGEFEEAAASEAIRRELLREGQVFYVHNRVQDIEAVAERVEEMAPEARVAVAHGQMDEGTLEKVVLDFWEGAYDVLVCTTIIESGIDMPTVNTLVVDRADLLGLGQLHQLRGRVGRAGQRAYAYLFHPVDRVLSEQAYERLRTIGDHTELGSGFKIALRDLQIRGAGNLLGRDQSGHIAAIGYDLYVQMVSEAVSELKGEPRPQPVELSLDLPDAAHLPANYVEAEDVRLEAYRRLTAVRTVEQIEDVRTEWEDRFGPLPGPGRGPARRGPAAGRVPPARHHRRGGDRAPRRGMGGGPRTGPAAKLSPITLPTSAEVRLRRLAPGATYQPDLHRLVMPRRRCRRRTSGTPRSWSTLLAELVPAGRPPGAAGRPPDSIAAVKRQLSGAVVALVCRHRAAGLGVQRHPAGRHGQRATISTATLNSQLRTLQTTPAGELPAPAGERPAGRHVGAGHRWAGHLLHGASPTPCSEPGRRPAGRAVRRLQGHHHLLVRSGHGQDRLRVHPRRGDQCRPSSRPTGRGRSPSARTPPGPASPARSCWPPCPVRDPRPRSATRRSTRSCWPDGADLSIAAVVRVLQRPTRPSSPRRA